MTNQIEFNKTCKACDEYVVLKTIDVADEMVVNGIILSNNAFGNDRLGHYQVLDIGKKAKEEYGVEVGDYVFADRLASYYHTYPIAVMKYNNLIVKTNKDKTEIHPLKNMVLVKDERKSETNVGGIIITDYKKNINIGTVIEANISEDKQPQVFNVGDKVMLTKGADNVKINGEDYFIYKLDMIICKIED
jgi:co-chaperonin GroES (HSP10)